MSSAHSPSIQSLHLRLSSFSFSQLSVASPTSQLILPTLPLLHLRHSSFSQPFRCFTYITAHSQTLPSLHLSHHSFSNPSVASRTSQFILQTLPLFHRYFIYVTWRAAHALDYFCSCNFTKMVYLIRFLFINIHNRVFLISCEQNLLAIFLFRSVHLLGMFGVRTFPALLFFSH